MLARKEGAYPAFLYFMQTAILQRSRHIHIHTYLYPQLHAHVQPDQVANIDTHLSPTYLVLVKLVKSVCFE